MYESNSRFEGEVSERSYERIGGFRIREADEGVGISFEERAAVLHRATLFLKHENHVSSEVILSLEEERARALEALLK